MSGFYAWKSSAIVFSALLLLVVSFSVLLPTQNVEAAGSISGTVFIDYNSNGVRNILATSPDYAVDIGVGGVTVSAFDSAGALRGTAVSSANGTYVLAATGTGPYRLEFTNLPNGFFPGSIGANSDSAVRFVPDGNSTGIDLGLMSSQDYCQNTPELVTTCFSGTVNGNSSDPVLISFPYESGTTSTVSSAGVTNPTSHDLMVSQNQLGSIWGLAFHRNSKKVFASAFTKRHAGFRNANKGTASNDPTGEIFISDMTGTTGSLFLNLNSLFGSNIAGDNPHDTADYQADVTAFAAVGKTAFGDLDISDDEQTLYVVNLNDRNLYAIPLGSGTPTAPTLSSQVTVYDLASLMDPGTGATGCPLDGATPGGEMNLNLRPGALKYKDGKVFVGLTCTAQSTGIVSDLRSFVYELDPAGSGSATQVANFALDYPRGCISDNGTVCAPAEWLPWTDNVNDLLDFTPWGQKYYPQPWLTDIEFDQNDFMILGMQDRVGHQTGNDNSGANTGTVEGVSAGDTLRLYRNGAVWSLENNASDNTNTTGGAGNGEGPGNGEFYFEEGYTITSNVHSEVTLGGLVNVPGYQEIVISAFDPAPTQTLPSGDNTYRAGGLIWLNNNTGARARSYQLFNIDTPNTFGKASGIGDVAAMCDRAPIQVGNRVWNDANEDGIQDPGEAVFANVGLEFWADTNGDGTVDTQIGSALTDANGNYVFGGPSNTNLGTYSCGTTPGSVDVSVNASTDDAEQYQATGNMFLNGVDLDFWSEEGSTPYFNYIGLRFNNVSIPAGATVTNAYIEFTSNDATVSSGSVTINIQAQDADNPGTFTTTNNDLGSRPRTTANVVWNPPAWTNNSLEQTPDLTAVVQEVVDRGGWADGNSLAFILSGAGSAAFREAETWDGDNAESARLVVDYTVPAICSYEVMPNTAYEIRVVPANFNPGAPLENYSPTLENNDSSANGDERDSDGIVISGTEVVIPFVTGERGNNDYSFDFGFRPYAPGFPIYSVGNRVWYDTDNDGVIDPAEAGIPGVSVSVYLDANSDGIPDVPGSPIQTLSSDSNGYYRFDSLLPNTYVISIDPVNFASGGVLESYRNTTGINTADAESYGAGSNAENGADPADPSLVSTTGVLSNPITLSAFAEPFSEADVPASGGYPGQGTFDRFADMTVDFGFYNLGLSGTLWSDRGPGADDNDGQLDAGETRVPDFSVRLYDAANNEINVGPDGILGTADDAPGGVLSDASGDYSFQGLRQGIYRVVVDPQGIASSGPTEADPNLNGDDNDNGYPDDTSFFPLKLISGLVSLTPGNTGAMGNNSVNNALAMTNDPTVDFGLLFAPTQVKMDKLDAYFKDGHVVIEWNTGGEAGNLGFNVYKSFGGGSRLLNSSPIAGSALRTNIALNYTGNEYRWVDRQPEPGAAYYIEDVDLNGTRTIHGPVQPQFKLNFDPQAKSSLAMEGFTVLAQSGRQKDLVIEPSSNHAAPNSAESAANVQFEVAGSRSAKILIEADDRYRVSLSDLQQEGFDSDSDYLGWTLFADGLEVPYELELEDGIPAFINFYGRGFESQFTGKQVYYLSRTVGSGLQIQTENEPAYTGEPSAASFRVTASRRDRGIYFSSLLNGPQENWFGAAVLASAVTEETLVVTDPDNLDSNDAKLKIRLQGITGVDHFVNVSFNGQPLGTVEFFGTENREFEFDVPMSAVYPGSNTIALQAAGSGGDVSLVDEVSIRYSRLYRAQNGKLRFSVAPGESARISGFASDDLDVFELDANGDPMKLLNVSIEEAGTEFGFSIGPSGSERQFAAFERDYVPSTPHTLAANVRSALHDPSNEAEMLIIYGNGVKAQAEALVGMKKIQGIETMAVNVEDIFDEFSFGKKSDTAIRDFLENAATNWMTAPGYVLLFGDSSYDMRNYLGQEDRDLVPTHLMDTKFMETSSDAWLADFDEDGVEDMSVGRLPAGNHTEAVDMVDKLERYDKQSASQALSNLLVADEGFERYSDTLESLLPAGVSSVKLNRASMSDAELHSQIVDEINGDSTVTTYTGHGSTNVWATDDIFNLDDPAGLTNQRLSFFMLMTCLNGYSHNANVDTLGENLFRAPNGAIAVWSSSGSTYAPDQVMMSQSLTAQIFEGTTRIGDLIREAKLSTGDADARLTWQLIGDPTTVVR